MALLMIPDDCNRYSEAGDLIQNIQENLHLGEATGIVPIVNQSGEPG